MNCEFEFGSFPAHPSGKNGYIYSGMTLGGWPSGFGMYDSDTFTIYATTDNNKYNGFSLDGHKEVNYYNQDEWRSRRVDGFQTSYHQG